MVVGNPEGDSKQANGLKFVCLVDKLTRWPELDVFPDERCRGGIMTVHHFPAFVTSSIPFIFPSHPGCHLQVLGWEDTRPSGPPIAHVQYRETGIHAGGPLPNFTSSSRASGRIRDTVGHDFV